MGLTKNSCRLLLDVGGTFLKSAVADAAGQLLSGSEFSCPIRSEGSREEIEGSLAAAVARGAAFAAERGMELAGIGIAICFRQGGSTGGTDIIAMIVNKYKTISYGRIVMTVDSMIILSSLFVGDMGVDSVIYGFVVTAVLGYTVDVIQAGNQQSSQIFVFTRRYEAMADQIIATTRHSATILDATGWYSKEDIKVVVVVCRKRETSQLLKLVRGVDGDAFISVGSVMGVYGKGFEALNKV